MTEVVVVQEDRTVHTIHTLDGPSVATGELDPIRPIVAEFLAGCSVKGRQTYADHLGFPYRVTATKTQPVGAPRDVSRLRNGVAYLPWCARRGLNPFEDVTRRHILAWVEDLKNSRNQAGERLDPLTQGQMVSCVSSLYTWACSHGPDGPASPITYATIQPVVLDRRALQLPTKTRESNTRSLTTDEVARLQREADNDHARGVDPLRTGTLVAVLFELGVRIDELVSLNRDDMSTMQGERVVTVTGKGGHRRTLKLTKPTAHRIDRYLEARDQRRNRATVPARQGEVSSDRPEPLFAARAPKTRALVALRAGEVDRKLKALAKRAGIENPNTISPHVARHTWATTARAAGVPESDIQAHFGHASAATTNRYGLHVLRITRSPVDKVAQAYADAIMHSFATTNDDDDPTNHNPTEGAA